MTTMTVGYFVWRADLRGGFACSKVLIDHTRNADYKSRLVSVHALDSDLWKKSLDELAVIFPAPKVAAPDAIERINQAES